MRYSIMLVAILLSGCGIPDDPEKGPVVLSCEGQEIARAGNGETERAHKLKFYRIDGAAHEISLWDEKTGRFGVSFDGLGVTATEARYSSTSQHEELGSTTTIVFDRASGRVSDEVTFTYGGNPNGTITFEARCKPVKDPASERKF